MSGIEIEHGEGAIDLDVKRFRMNGVVLKTKCPKCGADHERDFGDHYLAYPSANEDFDETLYCSECFHEWEVRLRLDLRLRVAEAPPKGGKLTICLDFDGVIHSYASGWQGIDTVADDVVDGFFEWADEAAKHFRLVVYSARSRESRGIAAMVRWMAAQRDRWRAAGNSSPEEAALEYASEKPKAFLYVDDRAHCFDGDWSKLTPEAIKAFKPWNKR